MRASDCARLLRALIPTQRPLFFWGPPGVGKSSIVKQVCKSMEYEVIDLRAPLLDPVDLRGLPSIKDGITRWCPPAFFPHPAATTKGIIFADELPQGATMTQAAMLQLCLDRQCGEYVLPAGWSILAAGNRQEDRAGTHKMISPLLNRFIHLDLEVSNDDWHAWAVEAQIAPEVRAFIQWRPEMLHNFDAAKGERAFRTPRSWSFVSEVLPHTPEDLLHPVVAGTVGEGPAAEFCGFVRIYRDLPDPDEVLARPTAATVPDRKATSVLYALCGALTERMRGADLKKMGSFMQYIVRLPSEFQVMAVRDAWAINPLMFNAVGFSEWNRNNKHLLGIGDKR